MDAGWSIRKQEGHFQSRTPQVCVILNDTLAWDIGGNRDRTQCLDIDPDMLYELENVFERIA